MMNKSTIQAQAEALIRATKYFTGKNIKHSEALDILSVLYQFKNYNELANYIKPETAFDELDDMEKIHAQDNLDTEYENECTIVAQHGRKICMPAYPEQCSYIRIVDRANHEIMYWNYEEWQEDPQDVMGAIMGALNGGASRSLPDFLQELPKKAKHNAIKVLSEPLNQHAKKEWVESDNHLKIVLALSQEEFQMNLEDLNDLVEEKILGENNEVVLNEEEVATIYLQDINYKLVGYQEGNLLVEVCTYFDLAHY
jgi:hypothetical protein